MQAAASAYLSPDLLRDEAAAELDHILAWWLANMTDRERGGFYGRRDGYGRLDSQADKGAVLNARILWTFSAAARATGEPAYRTAADRAFDYLSTHFWDTEHGGIFWSLDPLGQPSNTKKQVYAQAFALYAFAEYGRLANCKQSLQLAEELFLLLESRTLDPVYNGYFEAFTRDWRRLDDGRLSDKDANEAKTQNTHLHLLEAYTLLYRVAPSAAVGRALHNLILLFLDRFIDPASGHIGLFFAENWQLKSNTISFGHDIEASWLLSDAARALNEPALTARLLPVVEQMADAILREAVLPDGSVANERHGPNGPLDSGRVWWVQAEALAGFLYAARQTGREDFRHAAFGVWQFIRDRQKDRVDGEWHWLIGADDAPDRREDKAGFWKCPYHNGRAMIGLMMNDE